MSDSTTEPRTHKSMREESDRRIMAAAIEAFADRGYHRTSLNQIAAEAGFTAPLISKRYGSKAGLARAVFQRILGRLTPLGTERSPDGGWIDPDRSARAQLDDFVVRYLQDAIDEPTRLRALYVLIGESLGGMDELDDEVATVNRVFRDHIADYVGLGQRQGEFRADIDRDQAALIIVGTLRGVVTQVLAEPDAQDPRALTVELRRCVLAPLLRDGELPGDEHRTTE